MRTLLALAAVALCASAALPAAATAARRTCPGTVAFSGTKTKIVVLRGVSCARAKRVVRGYDSGRPPRPWLCALAHAPFDRVNGRIVGFSCGSGRRSGDLRTFPHAFLGTLAA
jgi:hypothetical protein